MKRTRKTLLSLLCTVGLLLSLTVAASAADYDFQGTGGQTLKLTAPAAVTVESTEGVYRNTITDALPAGQELIFTFQLSAGMNNYDENLFQEKSLPLIAVKGSYEGETLHNPTYVSGSKADGITIAVPALEEGSYMLVFGAGIQANNPDKTLGQDIVFQFTVSADGQVTPPETTEEPEQPEETPETVQCPYTDVSPEAAPAVMELVEKGYLTPESDTLLGADKPVTRSELVTLMGRCRDINAGKYTASSFADLTDDDPAMPYVEWAADKGLINGYGTGLVGPKDQLSREQAACILARYAAAFELENASGKESLGGFADKDQVSPWAKESVQWAVAAGLFTGDTLNPQAVVTRQEMAVMMTAVSLAEG